ncbi:MAG TPA: hypothetical protein VEA44_05450 [Caulobacter sp.]|nr:hypothetical protein [Caulobacter sp.]
MAQRPTTAGSTGARTRAQAPGEGAAKPEGEARTFAPPALAAVESRVTRSPVDPAAIPGWGVDADQDNDPTWPMRDRAFDDAPGRHWVSPSPQPQDIEVLMSIEHSQRPAVFGTATPPSGLSGLIRRAAFKSSESRWTHWLLLMAADRVNVVEGIVEDLARGRPPNLWKEFGFGAAWKHDREAFIRRSAVTAAVAGAAIAAACLLARRRN